MFLSRLFRRHRGEAAASTENSPVVEEVPAVERRQTAADARHTILQVIAHPRTTSGPLDRVAAATRLVDALRHLEDHPLSHYSHHFYTAVALRELDQLVDSMSYEELWDAFGGQCSLSGMREEDIKAIPVRTVTKEQAKGASCAVCLADISSSDTVRYEKHAQAAQFSLFERASTTKYHCPFEFEEVGAFFVSKPIPCHCRHPGGD